LLNSDRVSDICNIFFFSQEGGDYSHPSHPLYVSHSFGLKAGTPYVLSQPPYVAIGLYEWLLFYPES